MYYRGMFQANSATRLAATALFLSAAASALWLATADYLFRTGTPANLQRAAKLVPFRAEYQAAIGNWRRAVELNDYYSKGWIELGLAAEASGDYPAAERHLLKAASVDQLFEPRWALANFYVRRNRPGDFWHWIRLAAERSYGDRTGLFRLTTRMSDSPLEIADKVFPSDPILRQDFATFLESQGNIDSAASIALSLPVTDNNRDALLNLCDRLIHSGRGPAAYALWQKLAPAPPQPLTNPSLATHPLSKGFDWRIHFRQGITTTWTPGQLRIQLSGQQAESEQLLSQYLWVAEPGTYRFTFRYRTEGIAPASGLHWTTENAAILPPPHHLSSSDWRRHTLEFRVPAAARIIRLDLVYQRTPGTVRQEGTLFLEGGMTLAPSATPLLSEPRPQGSGLE